MANLVSSPCSTSILWCGCLGLAFAFPAVPHFNNRYLIFACYVLSIACENSYQYGTSNSFPHAHISILYNTGTVVAHARRLRLKNCYVKSLLQ